MFIRIIQRRHKNNDVAVLSMLYKYLQGCIAMGTIKSAIFAARTLAVYVNFMPHRKKNPLTEYCDTGNCRRVKMLHRANYVSGAIIR